MKHGDQVNTPSGLGVFFAKFEKDETKAYVVLKNPTENKVYVPLIELGRPVWDCFPCDLFNLTDLIINKTLEERKAEAEAAMHAVRKARDEALREKMKHFHQSQNQSFTQNNQNP